MFVSYRLHRYIASHDIERMIHWNANALELQQSSTKSSIIDMYVYCLQLSILNFSLADYVVCILAAYIHHESNKSYYPKYKYIYVLKQDISNIYSLICYLKCDSIHVGNV